MKPPDVVTANGSSMRATASRQPSGSASIGGSLIDGTGEHMRAQRRHLVGRRRAGRSQRVRRQPSHIAVARELAPGPAFVVGLVDGDALALERLAVERCLRRGGAAQRRLRLGDLAHSALDEARGGDFAFEMLGGEVGAGRRQARIESAIHSGR